MTRLSRFQWTAILVLLLMALTLTACEIPSQTTEPVSLDGGDAGEPTQPVQLPQPTPPPAEGQTGGDQPAGYPDPAAEPTQPPAEGETGGEQPAAEPTPPPAEGQTGGDQPATEPTPAPTTAVQPPADGVYVVQTGDTLGQIAERFGVSIQDIAAANNLANINDLDVGQELTIPEAGFAEEPTGEEGGERIHTVRSGDTLYSIGRTYGFTVVELQEYNNLTDPGRLEIGQEIRIPPGE